MADYDYSYAAAYQYDSASGTYVRFFDSPATGTTTDGDSSSNSFTVGEPLDNAGNSGVFGGTLVSGGTTWLIVWDSAIGSNIFTMVTATPGTAPDSVTTGDINESTFVVCFLAGTQIATPTGTVAIEDLKAGNLVVTHDGAVKPVRWLGRQTVSTVFADPLRVLPIRIAAGALGHGLPQRDLFVSPDHALLIEDVLVQAGALANGTSIARVEAMPEIFTYYHVELEDHALLLAEGVPAETFVDNVTRRRFDNWADAPQSPITEMELPRVKSARQLVPALRARLAGTAAA